MPAAGARDHKSPLHLLTIVLWVLAVAGLLLFVLAWAARSWLVLTFPFQVEYGEGPVADWARGVAQGRLPYKPIHLEPWSFSVYTPLYLLASGGLLALGLPLWLTGRLLSLLSALGLALVVALLGRYDSSRRGRWAALAAAGLFLASPYLARWATFYRPDVLGLFWSALGISFVAASLRLQRVWAVTAGGLCFVAAFLTKQSFVAAPLAALVALWLAQPRQALRLLLVMSVAGGVSLITLAALAGPAALWADLVTGNANPFSLAQLARYQGYFLRINALILLLALLTLWRSARRGAGHPENGEPPDHLLLGLYALASVLTTLGAGKAGAWENYFLEPFFAACVLAGRSLGRLLGNTGRWAESGASPPLPHTAASPPLHPPAPPLSPSPVRQRRLRPAGPALAALLVIVQLVLFLPGFERFGPAAERAWLASLRAERSALLAAVARTPTGEPLLSEDLGVLPSAGRPLFVHTFVYTQLAYQGDWDQAPLLSSIASRRFPLVVERRGALEDQLDLQRWTPEMLAAIESAYTVEGTAGDWLLLRPAPEFHPVDLPLNAALRLRGWRVEVNGSTPASQPIAVRPGDELRVHLLWERASCGDCAPGANEQSFVHLLDARDERLTQSDAPPRLGTVALTARRPALIHDTHSLMVPLDTQPGALTLLVGAYRLSGATIEPLGPPQRLPALELAP